MVGINMVADLPGSLNIRHVSIQSLTRSDRKARVCCELAHLRDPFQIQDQLFPIPIPVRVLEKPRKPSGRESRSRPESHEPSACIPDYVVRRGSLIIISFRNGFKKLP